MNRSNEVFYKQTHGLLLSQELNTHAKKTFGIHSDALR